MSSATGEALLITCEHGGNVVPPPYKALFRGQASLLNSHRGYDRGALALARLLARALDAPLRYSNTTRLLVDLNRSLGHPRLFSEITRPLDSTARLQIIDRHYLPYRGAVEERVRELLDRHGRVLHLSIHSFTPVWKGAPRVAGIGLLYDPCRKPEQRLAKAWQAALSESAPQLRVRRNYPYLGKADGFAAYLRRKLSARVYRGIEVELNQALFASASAPRMLARLLAETLETARR